MSRIHIFSLKTTKLFVGDKLLFCENFFSVYGFLVPGPFHVKEPQKWIAINVGKNFKNDK